VELPTIQLGNPRGRNPGYESYARPPADVMERSLGAQPEERGSDYSKWIRRRRKLVLAYDKWLDEPVGRAFKPPRSNASSARGRGGGRGGRGQGGRGRGGRRSGIWRARGGRSRKPSFPVADAEVIPSVDAAAVTTGTAASFTSDDINLVGVGSQLPKAEVTPAHVARPPSHAWTSTAKSMMDGIKPNTFPLLIHGVPESTSRHELTKNFEMFGSLVDVRYSYSQHAQGTAIGCFKRRKSIEHVAKAQQQFCQPQHVYRGGHAQEERAGAEHAAAVTTGVAAASCHLQLAALIGVDSGVDSLLPKAEETSPFVRVACQSLWELMEGVVDIVNSIPGST
jgi:hypothetical protein